MSVLPALREHVRLRAENRPGVYRMIDQNGDVLYVGKSVRVRSRVLSYFNAPRGEKPDSIMRQARAVRSLSTPVRHSWELIREQSPVS